MFLELPRSCVHNYLCESSRQIFEGQLIFLHQGVALGDHRNMLSWIINDSLAWLCQREKGDSVALSPGIV